MKRLLLVICAVLLAIPCLAFAGTLPDTGQTKCYDNSQEITCPLPGEPFYGQDAQYGPNLQSFTKLDASGNDLPDEATSWVMVRDNVTGLIWENKTDDGTIHDVSDFYSWNTAQDVFIATLNAQNFGGHDDWRLPTVKELTSILDRDEYDPVINRTFFLITQNRIYWSSTLRGSSTVWVIDFESGIIFFHPMMFSPAFVRAVRGEPCALFGNFIDNDDGTITDTKNGLMWQEATAPGTYTWEHALSYCKNLILNNNGEWTMEAPNPSGLKYDDWRLPNVNELQSLVDYSGYTPVIDPSNSWSSTTDPAEPTNAYLFAVSNGYLGTDNKTNSNYHSLLTVRGGLCGSLGDSDGDTVCNDADNCTNDYNPLQFDCDGDGEGDICDADTIDPDGDGIDVACDNCPNTPNQDQLDTYPPQGNGIGDACDCEADFNCDGNVASDDVTKFLWDTGRNTYNDPCTQTRPCNGDFLCDGSVDSNDVSLFIADTGRNTYNNPCPLCDPEVPWCSY